VPFAAAEWSDLACRYTATYTASYVHNGVSITEPTWLVLNAASRSFSVNATWPTALGLIEVTLTASIPQL
jgi:hypothetical protein